MSRNRKNGSKYDKKAYHSSVMRSFAMITQFGINMLVPICMMSALGIWMDNKFDTSFWTILLFFVGAIAGAQNIYRMAKKIYETDGRKEDISVHDDHRDVTK